MEEIIYEKETCASFRCAHDYGFRRRLRLFGLHGPDRFHGCIYRGIHRCREHRCRVHGRCIHG